MRSFHLQGEVRSNPSYPDVSPSMPQGMPTVVCLVQNNLSAILWIKILEYNNNNAQMLKISGSDIWERRIGEKEFFTEYTLYDV